MKAEAQKMYPIQTFWNDLEDEEGKIPHRHTGSKFYRHGNFVIFKHQEFDRKDNIAYWYSARFYVEQYQKALENLKQRGKVKMIGMGYSLTIEKKNQGIFEVTFAGFPSPPRNQKGELVTARLASSHKLEDLLLKD